jgi:hypothetical protein
MAEKHSAPLTSSDAFFHGLGQEGSPAARPVRPLSDQLADYAGALASNGDALNQPFACHGSNE